MSVARKFDQQKMVQIPEAIDMVSKIIARNNPYKGDEFTANYNRKIRNQALRFIEQVLEIEDIDRELIPYTGHIEDLWEVYLGFGETRCCNLSKCTIDLNRLEELAQENFCPISGNIQPDQCNALPEATMSAQKKRSSPSSALEKDDSDGAKKLADKRWAERNDMKKVIENFVADEMSKFGCTCLHSQMYEIVNFATDANKALIHDVGVISKKPLLAIIKSVYMRIDSSRILTHRPPQKNSCPVHGNK